MGPYRRLCRWSWSSSFPEGSELAVDQPHDLVTQIDRIMKINGLSVVTNDVIAADRSTLVIGEP
jgi:hypothetical protein